MDMKVKDIVVWMPGNDIRIMKIDTSKRVEEIYYKGEKGMTPIAYCYARDKKEELELVAAEYKQNESDHAKRQSELCYTARKLFGV